jgi:Mg-chelatase subunit ChlD
MGGIAVLASDREFLVGLSKTKQLNDFAMIPNLPPHRVAKYEVSSRVGSDANAGRDLGSLSLGGVAAEILVQPNSDLAHVLAGDDRVYTIDTKTMTLVGAEVPVAPMVDEPNYFFDYRVDYAHAALSDDGSLMFTNRGPTSELNVVDLIARRSFTASLGSGVSFAGGLAVNKGWINKGVVAVHAVDKLVTYKFDGVSRFTELARIAIDPPTSRDARIFGGRETWDAIGPKFSVAWTGSGQFLVAGTDSGAAEFVVIRVDDDGRSLSVHQFLTACPASLNFALGIHTLNGLITPPATATFVPTATETPSATPTATLTQTSTHTPVPTRTASPSATTTSSPTPTMQPAPLYIPLALSETCKREFRRVDLVLVLDTSSSMLDPTSTGRSKLDAAREAALSLVDSLDLSAGDRGGLVTFSETVTHRLAPTVRRDLLEATLMGLEASPGTCIPCGVEEGIQQLDALGVDPARTRTLVLLTDGLSTVRPIAEAITTAGSAASRGIEIFTVGLGEDVEIEGLRQIASQPSHFYRTLDAESLADIFATIVTEIPCPASSFWGWR